MKDNCRKCQQVVNEIRTMKDTSPCRGIIPFNGLKMLRRPSIILFQLNAFRILHVVDAIGIVNATVQQVFFGAFALEFQSMKDFQSFDVTS